MVQRIRVIVPSDPPRWETVVLAVEWDDLFRRCEELQDRYDRLKYSPVRREIHDPSCEQEDGDPYCSCRNRALRRAAHRPSGDAAAGGERE